MQKLRFFKFFYCHVYQLAVGLTTAIPILCPVLWTFHPIIFPRVWFFPPDQLSQSVVFLLNHLRVVLWGCQESGCVLLLLLVVAMFTGSGYSGSGDGAFAESAWLVMCTQVIQFDASSTTSPSRHKSFQRAEFRPECTWHWLHACRIQWRQAGWASLSVSYFSQAGCSVNFDWNVDKLLAHRSKVVLIWGGVMSSRAVVTGCSAG